MSGNQKAEGGLRLHGKIKTSLEGEPLLSVVTVVLNSKDFIEETILSVIHQTYKNIEYIIIDGGSDDGTLDIIKKYEQHIDYWVSEPDKGIYNAMNKGLKLISGEYVNFLNADDHYIDRRVTERIMGVFNNTHIQMIFGDTLMFNKQKGFGWMRHSDIGPLYYLFKGIPQQVYFYSADLFVKYGNFIEELKIIADLEFHLRVIRKYKIMNKYLRMPLVIFNSGATSSDMVQIEKERKQVIHKYYSRSTIFFFKNRFFFNQLARNDVFSPKPTLIDRLTRILFKP